MNFSGASLKQREKEGVALRSFILYSFIGSLALHIGLIAYGIGHFFGNVSEVEDELFEINLLEKPPEEIKAEPEKTQPQKQNLKLEKLPTNNYQVNTTKDIDFNKPAKSIKTQQITSSVKRLNKTDIRPNHEKVQNSVPLNRDTSPIVKVIDSQHSPQNPTKKTFSNPQVSTSTKLRESLAKARDARSVLNQSTSISNTNTNTQSIYQNNNLAIDTKSIGTQSSSDNSTNKISTSSNGTGKKTENSGNRGNAKPRGNLKVATAPTVPQPKIDSGSGNGRSNSKTNGNGRAACRTCKVKYPSWAKRRGVEGRIKVAVDTDSRGNVTNVRLLSSSGNSRLDKQHLRRAQKWKLKPNSSGRKGVAIATEYAIEGSRRHREIQKRKKQRAAKRRNRTTNNLSNSTTKTSRRRRRSLQSTVSAPTQTTQKNSRRKRRILNSSQNTSRYKRRSSNTTKKQPATIKRPQRINQAAKKRTRRFFNQSTSLKRRRLQNSLRRWRRNQNTSSHKRRINKPTTRKRQQIQKATSSGQSLRNRLRRAKNHVNK